jgi:hypothetical protein
MRFLTDIAVYKGPSNINDEAEVQLWNEEYLKISTV